MNGDEISDLSPELNYIPSGICHISRLMRSEFSILLTKNTNYYYYDVMSHDI